jgi:hypothetical protein
MYRQKFIPAKDMDFVTDLAEIEAETYEEAPPKNTVEKIWRWIVSTKYLPILSNSNASSDVNENRQLPRTLFETRDLI